MRVPEWLRKELREPGSQKLTAALLVGTPIFSIAQKFVNGYPWLSWEAWQTAVCGYAFFLVVYLPVAYLNRNTK